MGLADVIASTGVKNERSVEPADLETLARNLHRLFELVRSTLGEDAAHLMWSNAATKKRGRRKGSKSYNLDRLLSEYYRISKQNSEREVSKSAIIREIAHNAHSNHRGEYGSTAESINRRLLKEVNELESFMESLLRRISINS